jgi:hypothetical protein
MPLARTLEALGASTTVRGCILPSFAADPARARFDRAVSVSLACTEPVRTGEGRGQTNAAREENYPEYPLLMC